MFKVETAKKIHVVYKNPIEKEVVSNACGCSGVDGEYSNFTSKKKMEADKKRRAEILSGGTISSLGAKTIDTGTSPSITLKDTATGSYVDADKKKMADKILSIFNNVKDSQGAEVAIGALKDIIAKRKAKGEYVSPEMYEAVGEDDKKITTLGWVGISVGALALIGLVVYVVKNKK